jgi:hypothetical protein
MNGRPAGRNSLSQFFDDLKAPETHAKEGLALARAALVLCSNRTAAAAIFLLAAR